MNMSIPSTVRHMDPSSSTLVLKFLGYRLSASNVDQDCRSRPRKPLSNLDNLRPFFRQRSYPCDLCFLPYAITQASRAKHVSTTEEKE